MSLASFHRLRENPTQELIELAKLCKSYQHLVDMGMISNPCGRLSQAEGMRRLQHIRAMRSELDLTKKELAMLVNIITSSDMEHSQTQEQL